MFGVLAMVVGSYAKNINDDIPAALMQVAAGVYIVIRGLDNIKMGIDKNPNDPVKKLWDLIYGDDGLAFLRRWREKRERDKVTEEARRSKQIAEILSRRQDRE